MRDHDFDVLLAAVEEAVEHHEGRRDDLRTTRLPIPPAENDTGGESGTPR